MEETLDPNLWGLREESRPAKDRVQVGMRTRTRGRDTHNLRCREGRAAAACDSL